MELAIDNPPHLSVLDDIACDLLPNAQATSSEPEASKDAFGCLGDDKSDASDKGRAGKASGKTVNCARKVDLRDYWQVETATEKEQRHHREWERLEREHKTRAFQNEQIRMRQHGKVRADNRKRAQRYCTIKREKRIEAGWVPGQKRVSVAVLTSNKILTSCLETFGRVRHHLQ